MNEAKIKETSKQIADLLAKNGLTYSEVSRVIDEATDSLYVVTGNSGIVYRDGKPYERKPYAKELTPVSVDT